MSAHTPGPWLMETVSTSCGVCFKVGPFPWGDNKLNHACIYADYPSSTGFNQCKANAMIIAAAPDLLAALESVKKAIDDSGHFWINDLSKGGFDIESIDAAIKKAKGE